MTVLKVRRLVSACPRTTGNHSLLPEYVSMGGGGGGERVIAVNRRSRTIYAQYK